MFVRRGSREHAGRQAGRRPVGMSEETLQDPTAVLDELERRSERKSIV